VTLVIHRILETRETWKKPEKMNMVIGTFFSIAGNRLLRCFAKIQAKHSLMPMICSSVRHRLRKISIKKEHLKGDIDMVFG
jgi:hypothetical protein